MKPATLIPLDPRNLSLLWASPERVPTTSPSCTRACSIRPGMPPASAASIEHPAAAAFIAQIREPKALAGFVIGQIAGDEAEILSIGVAPEWQRRGIGRQMVEGLVRAARRAEVKRLFLEVAADNDRGHQALRGARLCQSWRAARATTRARAGAPVDALILSLAL